MSLLMMGCGKLGGSLLPCWAISTKQKITMINPSFVKAPLGVIVTKTSEKLSNKRFDIIVIAIKSRFVESAQVLINAVCYKYLSASESELYKVTAVAFHGPTYLRAEELR